MPKGERKNKYSGEFKQKVVEDLRNSGLSYREAAKKYEIPTHKPVMMWERIYLEEGPEGLYIERRGRTCGAVGVQKGRKPRLDKEIEEDLIAENQRLRAEVAYLKKLNALVLKEERKSRKRK